MEAEEAEPDLISTSQGLDLFLDESFEASCEGLMAKALDEEATYMASKRSDSWLKVQNAEGLFAIINDVHIIKFSGSADPICMHASFYIV